MGVRVYRHESKHYINYADYLQLRARLRPIARPDPHGGAEGCYRVRSLYFDNYNDKAVTDKLSGQCRREKFRLRYYNEDTSYIRLEKKSKNNKGCLKETEMLKRDVCESLLAGDFSALLSSETPLLSELYAKNHFQQIKPRSIVDYMREAYIFTAGNVRITIDSNIRTSNNIAGFLDPTQPTIPAANAMILEIKFDGFLPDIIRDIVQLRSRRQTEFSKYVVARLVH